MKKKTPQRDSLERIDAIFSLGKQEVLLFVTLPLWPYVRCPKFPLFFSFSDSLLTVEGGNPMQNLNAKKNNSQKLNRNNDLECE
ncbi:hypothetical protein NH340_JMT00740 [Sarcoptes scabiei]|nr:hypothetical protein NH340_JMT00740 [Sarcoptes scabiei]